MYSPPNPAKKRHFFLVSRLVVPGLTAFSKSGCVKSLYAFFLPEVWVLKYGSRAPFGVLSAVCRQRREKKTKEKGPKFLGKALRAVLETIRKERTAAARDMTWHLYVQSSLGKNQRGFHKRGIHDQGDFWNFSWKLLYKCPKLGEIWIFLGYPLCG